MKRESPANYPGNGLKWLALALVLVFVAGCSNQKPAPVTYRGSGTPAKELRAATKGVAKTVIVRKGDSLYVLARRQGISVRELIDANGLRPPYLVRPGQRLKLPAPKYHVVGKGDTVYAISRAYRVDMASLVRANRIKAPYTIRVGQKLALPGSARPSAVTPKPRAKVGKSGSKPARKSAKTRTAKTAVPAPPPRAGKRFAWPIKGKVVSRFGAKPGGLHNDGINIQVKAGQPVRASENGVVAYSGNELRGFGNLLLVRHDGGWITAYAHNEKLLVSRGDKVSRGQVIAQAGNTGNVNSPQLHFEIRKGATAVNPQQFLAALTSPVRLSLGSERL